MDNWKKCSDRKRDMPDEGQVVFWRENDRIWIGDYSDNDDGCLVATHYYSAPDWYDGGWNASDGDWEDEHPTHWHPFPGFPVAEEKKSENIGIEDLKSKAARLDMVIAEVETRLVNAEARAVVAGGLVELDSWAKVSEASTSLTVAVTLKKLVAKVCAIAKGEHTDLEEESDG